MADKKKIALVVGANGGIGFSATCRLLNDDFFVCATYFKKKNNLEEIKAKNKDLSKSLFTKSLDVRNEAKVAELVMTILNKFKRIDAVIFSVSAEYKYSRALDSSWDDFNLHFEVQVKAIHNFIVALQEQIKAQFQIKFIAVLSDSCFGVPPKGFSPYVSAKYAALGLSKSLAVELAEYGSTFNMISPGMVETTLLKNLPAKLLELNAHENPLKKNAKAGDVSSAISFLCSDRSDYLNGTNIVINGGKIMA